MQAQLDDLGITKAVEKTVRAPVWALVADITGFHDTFKVSDAIVWCAEEVGAQAVRDACRLLCRHGILKRVGRGVYKWEEQ